MIAHTVGPGVDGMLLRVYLKSVLGLSTNSRKRLRFRENGIILNGKPVVGGYVFVKTGDRLLLDTGDRPSDNGFSDIIPSELSVQMIYEDSLITVCDKPPFMPTHPVHGHLDDTLANALAFRALNSGADGFTFRPVNRLDRNTSGIQLSSKDFVTSGRLAAQLRNGRIKKQYLALVCGVPEKPVGRIDAAIERAEPGTLMRTVKDDGSPSVTIYRTLGTSPDGACSLILAEPLTGRTHQIRVHMAYIGCPLLGDFLYGKESPVINRHALHAAMLSFDYPDSPDGGKRMVFRSACPEDMTEAMRFYGIV
ncbi:MAG: RluA family pseudouridine synthase [Clostridia bacterium]|nr:RluA family pseudouridine synthase [Clostridia bacterium]